MFCTKCGKEVEDTWVKCPYCGNVLQENQNPGHIGQEKCINVQTGIDKNDTPNHIMSANPTSKKKSRLPVVIGGIVIVFVLLFILLLGGSDDSAPDEVVALSSYEGGFAGWEASGFEGSVRTDITIPYPITYTDVNNYAVYIGTGGINVGVIMQKDESAISEWDWLMNAQPDIETQAYYFNCTLTYAQQTVGENEIPVFVIEDVQQGYNAIENQQVTTSLDASKYAGVDYGFIYGGILDGIIDGLDSATSSDELSYAFYDIDKDGYMEFLIENGKLEYEVWTTTGEGCSCLGTISDARNIGLYEYMNGNGVYTDFCHMGYEVITLVDSKEGVLMETPIFEGENIEEYGYHLDGTPFEELAFPIKTHTLQEGLVW